MSGKSDWQLSRAHFAAF
nr:unnamed protein product [Callosobruchus analis]